MILADKDGYIYVLEEGTGDNLLPEDIEAGYEDYFMLSVYKKDGYELEESDSAQVMTKNSIPDMTEEEKIDAVKNYYGFEDGELKLVYKD